MGRSGHPQIVFNPSGKTSAADLDYEKTFRHKLYDIELEVGEAFSVTAHNKNEWRTKYWMTPLYQNISREGIRI
jgi:hypothetical protein